MTPSIKQFLMISSVFLSLQAAAETQNALNEDALNELAKTFNINPVVLSDFVDSYNFKCPQELSAENLVAILNTDDDETELSAMIESDRLDWRDMYVEARSGILCLHDGVVSNAY